MKITNNLGLPEALYRAVLNDNYSKGIADYSVSELVNPPQITILKQRHWSEIEEDVSDRIWTLLGKAVHHLLENSSEPGTINEIRLYTAIGRRVVSGKFDRFRFRSGKLTDWKLTSAWSIVYGSTIREWTAQLNSYAYLLANVGYTVTELEVVAILRDWSPTEAQKYPDYPEIQVQVIPIELWSEEAQRLYLQERVELLKTNEMLPDDQLTPCSSEEMWENPTRFAVMRYGRKSAVRMFNTQDEADEFRDQQGNGHFVEVRPGSRVRCEGKVVRGRLIKYCPVRDFCSQFRKYGQEANTKEVFHHGR